MNLDTSKAQDWLKAWFETHLELFRSRGGEAELRDEGRGAACVLLETQKYFLELCAWNHASCLDIQILEIDSEAASFPHVGPCEGRAAFEAALAEFIDWFTATHEALTLTNADGSDGNNTSSGDG